MTADLGAVMPPKTLNDSGASSQSTDKSNFSRIMNDQKSQSSKEPKTTDKVDSKPSDTQASPRNDTAETKEPEASDGNDLPEDTQALPEDAQLITLTAEEMASLKKLAELDELSAGEVPGEEITDVDAVATVATAVAAPQEPINTAIAASMTPVAAAANPSQGKQAYDPLSATASISSRSLKLEAAIPHSPTEAAPELTVQQADKAGENLLSDQRLQQAQLQQSLAANSQSPASVQDPRAASLTQAAASATPPTLQQPAIPLKQDGWDQALGNSVKWMMNENLQEASIRVKPQELGPIHVKVSMQNDQLALTFNASHAATRDMLESAIPRLREMMGASGLDLGNVNVGDQGQGQSFARGADSFDSNGNGGSQWQGDDGLLADADLTPEAALVTSVSNIDLRAVDIFA